MPGNIYLVGYRGTGKSSLAPRVAGRLGADWNWIDLDAAIERRAGTSIAAIFATEGEEGFREREGAELAAIAGKDRWVVATGGGTVLRPANRRRLRDGWVVWLTASPQTIEVRLQADPSTAARRPKLTPWGGLDEIQRILAEREPLYRELAYLTLPTDEASLDDLADRIVAEWSAWRTNRSR